MKTSAFTSDIAQQRDSLIHRVSYVARSSIRFKRYKAPTPVQTVMDSGGYHYMTIPTIKDVIGRLFLKSQYANHAVMKIRNIRANQLQHAWYLFTGTSIREKDRTLDIVIIVQLYRIYYNTLKIVNSLHPPRVFFQIGFPCKNLLSLFVFVLKSLLTPDNRDIPNLHGVSLTVRTIVSQNLHHNHII